MGRAEAGRPAIWGYIEGYYGRIFDWDERTALVDHLAGKRFAHACPGAYLYAPKEDSLHRRDWRIRYPSEWRRRFQDLALRGARRGVEVVPGMAPGLSFDYLAADDYRALLGKFRDFQKLGCRTLA
ncbi:MAG TPA: beta-N-acetylglucosaminidase domain-containing protein, partial [Fibrobacteria bacterium]|nr:beta-N-acetylglucosaminidase domain-containing protein [Fibrobacteria bacterium]